MSSPANDLPVSVLFIHPVGAFGGASRSLLELVRAFPENTVRPHLFAQAGNAVSFFQARKIPVIAVKGISQLDNTQYGYYRGARWLILLREIGYLPFTVYGLIRAKRAWPDIDVIHANEVTLAVTFWLAKRMFNKPLVVHVRSVQRDFSQSLRGRFVGWTLRRCANAVIAIDQTVRKRLPSTLPVHVVHNGLNLAGSQVRQRSFSPDAFKSRPMRVAFVGNLLRLKGVVELVQAAKICTEKGLNIEVRLVGEVPRKNSGPVRYALRKLGLYEDLGEYLRLYVEQNRLQERVRFPGFVEDVREIYGAVDILCFPSHLNAVGRPTIEAALFGVPSIVAVRDPERDTIIPGETGLCIREKDPHALANAIEYFYQKPAEIHRMGQQARQLAEEFFDIQRNAREVLKIYRSCLK